MSLRHSRLLWLLLFYLLLLGLGGRSLIAWLVDRPRSDRPSRTHPGRVQW